MKQRFTVNLIRLALFLNAAIVLYGLYLSFWPFKTIDITNTPIPIVNEHATVAAGQRLIYRAQYCKYINVSSRTVKTLVGSEIVQLPTANGNLPLGCGVSFNRNTIIPVETPPGTYYLDLSSSYQVNPLRNITRHFKTATFTVTAPVPGQIPAVPEPVLSEEKDSTAIPSSAVVVLRSSQPPSQAPQTVQPIVATPIASTTPSATPSPSPGLIRGLLQSLGL